jgi:hypothetical protein
MYFGVLLLLLPLQVATSSPAPPVRVELAIVAPSLLEVRIVGLSRVPVLLSGRLSIPAYLEISVRDGKGTTLKYGGPLTRPSRPEPCSFRMLGLNEMYGVRVSLRSTDSFALKPGQHYTVIATFHDQDSAWALTRHDVDSIRRSRGPFVELAHEAISDSLDVVLPE